MNERTNDTRKWDYALLISLTSRMLSTLTPPSISNRQSTPASSINLRASLALSSVAGMKAWPPNPGFTLIRRMISSLSITYLATSKLVAGLNTSPALHPPFLINCKDRSTWFVASGWNVMYEAPASMNPLIASSTASEIYLYRIFFGIVCCWFWYNNAS